MLYIYKQLLLFLGTDESARLYAADILKSNQRMVKSMPTGIQPDWLADPPPKKEPKIRTKTKAKSRKT